MVTARLSARDRRRLSRLAGIVALVLAGCVSSDQELGTSTDSDEGVVFRTDLEDAETFNLAAPDGSLEDVSDAELTAACQVMLDARRDVFVGDDLIVVTTPRLLRATELLDGLYRGSSVAQQVEALILNGTDGWSDIEASLTQDFGLSEVSEGKAFYDSRALAPSEAAEGQYVVYVAMTTLSDLQVVRQRIYPLPDQSLVGNRGADMARLDGTAIEIQGSWCSADARD